MNAIEIDAKLEAVKLHRKLQKVLHFNGESINIDFFISSLTEYNPFNTTEEIADWLQQMNKQEYFHVHSIPLKDLENWYFDPWTGDLSHQSGGYFSIRGLEVYTNVGPVRKWTQPIIDQPKIGILGIITKKINGILYLLMQAKAEPGNLHTFQIAPTVQATRSNFMRLHKGKPTRYIDYFLKASRATILSDQLQSEQGARFFHKRNRNIIIQIPDDEDIDLEANFRWVTLGQLKRLMLQNNTVNMDARSVISTISFIPEGGISLKPVSEDDLRDCLESSKLVEKPPADFTIKMMVSGYNHRKPLHSMDDLLHRLSFEKFQCELSTHLIPLLDVKDWSITPMEICHDKGLYFSVIGLHVEAGNREVPSWDQPIVKQHHPGIVGFICRPINGVIHFLVQLKMESGNIDLLEMAPTVQCITGSYDDANLPPYVGEMLNPSNTKVIFDTIQSEEGGRFYKEENRNMLLLGDETFPLETPERYVWISLKQLKEFLKFNNFLNVESRSLLAII